MDLQLVQNKKSFIINVIYKVLIPDVKTFITAINKKLIMIKICIYYVTKFILMWLHLMNQSKYFQSLNLSTKYQFIMHIHI